MIAVSGKMTSEHPMYFETDDITYDFERNPDVDKIRMAVKMSVEKYSGLTYMLRNMTKSNIKDNGEW
ncbi:MAG: hypothetical protein IPL46_02435 [Saprospiraceae bacterium]|nr:hypothetical protein [Saprospiraceae bacterium]